MEQKMRVNWIDGKRAPSCPPNQAFPDGIDVDVSNGAKVSCLAALPYPARRIGQYVIKCTECGATVACTTAGRPDDPRSIRIACQTKPRKEG